MSEIMSYEECSKVMDKTEVWMRRTRIDTGPTQIHGMKDHAETIITVYDLEDTEGKNPVAMYQSGTCRSIGSGFDNWILHPDKSLDNTPNPINRKKHGKNTGMGMHVIVDGEPKWTVGRNRHFSTWYMKWKTALEQNYKIEYTVRIKV